MLWLPYGTYYPQFRLSMYGHRALTGTVTYPLTYTGCIVFEAPPSTPTKCEGPYGRVIYVCLRERWPTPHVGRHLCCQLAVCGLPVLSDNFQDINLKGCAV
jgi:hypothetical protein